ncbi:MAG TPA: hypothetical protein VE777_04555 [Gaiellales bacterium]|nr:hypothetical protein [Gaiellales bacterium]
MLSNVRGRSVWFGLVVGFLGGMVFWSWAPWWVRDPVILLGVALVTRDLMRGWDRRST